ncbi:hypothetical protein GA0074695_4224 [Micromonospora viridifaciens]|uniref:Uncharacterized protein n=1 Tax=Micromonospora viridifaciens TaxID=1881 RepID=A0A1C4YFM8_MICVI|nr:hypothetical protein [Micromonospora viridifaciens]SCF19480.1 hypothetical protein GA0074695_4224 [Micromonospora viridifaciens]
MTDPSLADQIRTLHTETTAAIQQRQTLAVEARSALIAALRNRLICRPGCEDALATCGLEPLPQRWTIFAGAQLSYTRSHTDHNEAREQARFGVPDELRLLQPAMAVYPRHVIDVTPDGNDQRYSITVQVTLQTWVTATREADAHQAARAVMEAHLPGLADAGITLTGLTWQAADSPDDVALDNIDTAPQPVADTAQLTELTDDLTAATAARDAAVQALTDLQRAIRARAISALVDDEIGGIYQHTAQRVDRFLVDLGLDPLPRAHHFTVVADLTLPVRAGTAREACDAARAVMRTATTSSPDETRPWTAYGWTIPEHATSDQDRWRIPWRHEYEMWLRGHATSADATAAAEALARADLTQALAGIDHNLITVTTSVEGVGVDLYLDPDSD